MVLSPKLTTFLVTKQASRDRYKEIVIIPIKMMKQAV